MNKKDELHKLIKTYVYRYSDQEFTLASGKKSHHYFNCKEIIKQGKIVYPLIVRKETKDHGTKKEIEGQVDKVKSCLVVDDVITTGGSTLKAVEALRRAGIKVESGICILDREEGGYESLLASGVQMYPVFKKADFI